MIICLTDNSAPHIVYLALKSSSWFSKFETKIAHFNKGLAENKTSLRSCNLCQHSAFQLNRHYIFSIYLSKSCNYSSSATLYFTYSSKTMVEKNETIQVSSSLLKNLLK